MELAVIEGFGFQCCKNERCPTPRIAPVSLPVCHPFQHRHLCPLRPRCCRPPRRKRQKLRNRWQTPRGLCLQGLQQLRRRSRSAWLVRRSPSRTESLGTSALPASSAMNVATSATRDTSPWDDTSARRSSSRTRPGMKQAFSAPEEFPVKAALSLERSGKTSLSSVAIAGDSVLPRLGHALRAKCLSG